MLMANESHVSYGTGHWVDFEVALVKNKAAIEYSFTPLGDTLEAPVRSLYNRTRANCFPYSSRQ